MAKTLIQEYFYKFLPTLGDLTTYNEEPRIIDHFVDGCMVRFHIEWWPQENEKPQMVEIHVTIRNTKNKIYKKAWVYFKDDDWYFQHY